MGRSRTFRIFVSSTFSDLKEERNALQATVFPRLRELCTTHGARFQAIDLRWGVSEEASLDQQTMNICLEEIDRCRRTTPRPNFIVLLGHRYGWRPLPPQIPESEFAQILDRLAAEERDLAREWYRRDDNAVPVEYVLQPRTGSFADHRPWRRVEDRLGHAFREAVRGLPLEAFDRLKYEASATEQEIHRGALRVPDEHVFCFFRSIRGLPENESAAEYIDLVPEQDSYRRDAGAAQHLDALKDKLRSLVHGNVHHYEASWTGTGVTLDHLERLCEDVYLSLSQTILEELEQDQAVDPLRQEIEAHRVFGGERTEGFTGRGEALAAIESYLQDPNARVPMAVVGPSGSGKSALLARAAQLAARRPEGGRQTVLRLIGATPDSSDTSSLLLSLCHQISRLYGADETTIPTDPQELSAEFPKRLALATATQPLLVCLDALDQLRGSLNWLPVDLPKHVRLVVSASTEFWQNSMALRAREAAVLPLAAMPPTQGGELLDRWLQDAGRSLRAHQWQEVLAKFADEGLPLYLKLAFEEARRWRSYADPSETTLARGIPGLIRDNMLARLSDESNHGRILVSRSLAYLAASKNGLTEDELLEVLSRDGGPTGVLADYQRRSPRSPEVDHLPVVVWSRLYFDLEPYLSERSADGTSLLAFYHRQLAEVVEEEFLAGEEGLGRHRELARFFDDQALGTEKGETPNLRKLSELPYQLTLGEMWDELFSTLTDFQFIEARATHSGVVNSVDRTGEAASRFTGVFQLQGDYAFALERMPGNDGGAKAGRQPVILTAVDLGDGLALHCPHCLKATALNPEWLGREIRCPQQGCGERLRINPFTVASPRWAARH